jgi:hypothetical protein
MYVRDETCCLECDVVQGTGGFQVGDGPNKKSIHTGGTHTVVRGESSRNDDNGFALDLNRELLTKKIAIDGY